MRRAILLAGSLALTVLAVACDHYHGVCDCAPITNSATCGFYNSAQNCGTPAGQIQTGAPILVPTAAPPTQPVQQMPRADAPNK